MLYLCQSIVLYLIFSVSACVCYSLGDSEGNTGRCFVSNIPCKSVSQHNTLISAQYMNLFKNSAFCNVCSFFKLNIICTVNQLLFTLFRDKPEINSFAANYFRGQSLSTYICYYDHTQKLEDFSYANKSLFTVLKAQKLNFNAVWRISKFLFI